MASSKKINSSMFERHACRTMFLFITTFLLIFDFAGANIYKFLHGYPWSLRAANRERIYRIPSSLYHHDLAAKSAVRRVSWGPYLYDYYTNSLGFRDQSTREIALIPKKHRIIFMGDSFTEGLGIDYEHTFVGLIDAALSRKGIEVLNAAVASYSPIIYWRKTKYLIETVGLKFNQLIVYLDISDAEDEARYYSLNESGNVVRTDYKMLESRYKKPTGSKAVRYMASVIQDLKGCIRDNSVLLYAMLDKLRDIIFPIDRSCIHSDRSRWTIDDAVYREYGQQGLREMELYMDKLYELLKENRIKLTVAVYPWTAQIIQGDPDSLQVVFWRNWCEQHDVDFINYFPYFINAGILQDRIQVADKYFLKHDAHWNAKGHQLVADGFLAYYENR